MKTRTESDSIGSLEIDEGVYYGVQTLRAKQNFSITKRGVIDEFIINLAMIKKAAAISNMQAGLLQKDKADAIIQACDEVMNGKFMKYFITDQIQGGAGTSMNMNMNEVVANRANEILGGKLGAYDLVHPNDHVNMAQSTNDVIPTAGKMTTLTLLAPLYKEMEKLHAALSEKAIAFKDILKMGRTQLQDAVPMTLGNTFESYATMIERCMERIRNASKEMTVINLGGTAIGSKINASGYYEEHIVENLNKLFFVKLYQAKDLFDATENLDSFVEISGSMKALASSLSKMCNDLRLLSSGPRCGFNEINLPAMQNGSSIMPGKVNPVIPEVVTQTCYLVMGHDVTITMAAEAGQMELNAFEPVIFSQLFESIQALTGSLNTLTIHCIQGITANKEHCLELEKSSLGIVTALAPYLGYKESAHIAKKALKENKSIEDVVLEENLMSKEKLESILNEAIEETKKVF
jgi:aspartate ammonia-lyase